MRASTRSSSRSSTGSSARPRPRAGRSSCRRHILSEVEKTCDRVAIIRDGRLVRVDRTDALRDLAHHQVELVFTGRCRSPRSRRCPASATSSPRTTSCACGSPAHHAGRPGRRAVRAARLRQPRALARRDVPRRVRQGRRRGGPAMTADVAGARLRPSIAAGAASTASAASSPRPIRDSRRATIIVAAFLSAPVHRRRAGDRRRDSARRSRGPRSRRLVKAAVPPILQGLAGKVVNVEHPRRLPASTSTASSSRSSSASGRSSPCPGRSPARPTREPRVRPRDRRSRRRRRASRSCPATS